MACDARRLAIARDATATIEGQLFTLRIAIHAAIAVFAAYLAEAMWPARRSTPRLRRIRAGLCRNGASVIGCAAARCAHGTGIEMKDNSCSKFSAGFSAPG